MMLSTVKLDRLMTKKYPKLKTQEAYSALRTLHHQYGQHIKNQLVRYLYTDEAWELSEEAYVELWGVVRGVARRVIREEERVNV